MEAVPILIQDFFQYNEGAKCVKIALNDTCIDVTLDYNGKQIPFKLVLGKSSSGNEIINIEPVGKNSTELMRIINAVESKGFKYVDNIYDILELMNKMLTESHKHCVICAGPLEYPSERPSACGDKLCQYKAEEVFLDDQIVLDMLKKSPEVFKFLVESSVVAINSRACETRFEPFPARFLIGDSKDRYIRGELTALNGNKIRKDIERLRTLVGTLGNIGQLMKDTSVLNTEQELRHALNDDLYYLIRFIVKSNTTHLEPVRLFDENQMNGIQQFKIRYTSEVEETFNAKIGSAGHCFLFHGSGEENWHSILRNGLKNCSGTKLQTNGAAYGNGIYLSDNYITSIGYSRGSMCVIGVCQVVGNKSKYKKGGSNIYVANEHDLILRYLFVGSHAIMMKVSSNIFNTKFGLIVEETKTREKVMTSRGNNRLMKELNELQREEIQKMGFVIKNRGDDLFTWDVFMTEFDPESPITGDLQRRGVDSVHVEISFPITGQKYPFAPPFVRVVYPRFEFHTGHITIGGSVCIELLTPQGWSSVYKIESLLVQLKALVLAGGARLDETKWNVPYDVREAKGAFTRVARQHGWM